MASAIERKQREPQEETVVISLACHQQERSEVMFVSVGVDSAALYIYSRSVVAL